MLGKLIYAYSCHYVSASSTVEAHFHPIYECVYYTKGTGCIHTSEGKYMYSPGAFMIIRPNVTHSEVHYSPTMAICLGYLALDEDAGFQSEVTVLSVSSDPTILASAQMIIDEQTHKYAYCAELCEALFSLILISIKRMQGGAATMTPPAQNIIANLGQTWNPDSDSDITDIWNANLKEYESYSYDRFRHVFKNRMNVSPTQFLLQLRMHKAMYLLTNTAMNITAIALACGFSSCSYFTQQFRKVVGITPSRYRMKLSNSPTSLITWEEK